MLKVAVVGLGWWGRTIVGQLQGSDKLRPVLLVDVNADAAEGRAPYPVPQEQMIANISALEAVFKSTRSGVVEIVEG